MNNDFLNKCYKILNPLINQGWIFEKNNENEINMIKKYYELNQISILANNDYIELVLPMKNETYSFYKKITPNQDGLNFIENYIQNIIYV